MFFVRLVAGLAALAWLASPLLAAPKPSPQSHYLRIYGQALPPFGFVQFCQRFKSECVQGLTTSFDRFDATPRLLSELDQINRRINRAIRPVTDLALYGQEEYWTFPSEQGDCEDYVLLKRRTLMQQGWPASALLITVVLDERGDGHAILTVRTKQGDYVLDNKVDEVLLWNQTPYTYLMRQSYLDPTLWMALDPSIPSGANAVAGVNTR